MVAVCETENYHWPIRRVLFSSEVFSARQHML